MVTKKTDGYRKEARARAENAWALVFMTGKVISNVKVGDKILMPVAATFKETELIRPCIVTEVWPHFVKARYRTDMGNLIDTTFDYGALVMAGYEKSGVEK